MPCTQRQRAHACTHLFELAQYQVIRFRYLLIVVQIRTELVVFIGSIGGWLIVVIIIVVVVVVIVFFRVFTIDNSIELRNLTLQSLEKLEFGFVPIGNARNGRNRYVWWFIINNKCMVVVDLLLIVGAIALW
jgi:hypothetical protein